MESRYVCTKCGGWIVEDMQTGDGNCDTCGRKVLIDGKIDDSDCEISDFIIKEGE